MIKPKDGCGWAWRSEEEVPDPKRGLRIMFRDGDDSDFSIRHLHPKDDDTRYSEHIASLKTLGYTEFWWCYLDEDLL